MHRRGIAKLRMEKSAYRISTLITRRADVSVAAPWRRGSQPARQSIRNCLRHGTLTLSPFIRLGVHTRRIVGSGPTQRLCTIEELDSDGRW